jgi:hypothetical protein
MVRHVFFRNGVFSCSGEFSSNHYTKPPIDLSRSCYYDYYYYYKQTAEPSFPIWRRRVIFWDKTE